MTNVTKGGRCFNGAHRDSGVIVHIVAGPIPNGPWMDKALCGVRPGQKGYGWAESHREANCTKCLKKKGGQNA